MTDQELKDLVASLAEESKKTEEAQRKTDEQMNRTDVQMKRTDEQLQKTDEKLNKIAKLIGAIGNNQGDVAEEYFINSLKDKLSIGTLNFDYLVSNYIISGKKIKDEFDILLINGESVAIIEVKYKVHPSDIDKIEQKINNFKQLPQYRGYKVYAGIAGFYVSSGAKKIALEKGYFVLQRKGDIIETYDSELRAA